MGYRTVRFNRDSYLASPCSRRMVLICFFASRLTQEEWSAELVFRVNGEERGDGNLQLWFVKDGQSAIGTSSIYNSSPFEGLAISIDMNSGRVSQLGGSKKDIKVFCLLTYV